MEFLTRVQQFFREVRSQGVRGQPRTWRAPGGGGGGVFVLAVFRERWPWGFAAVETFSMTDAETTTKPKQGSSPHLSGFENQVRGIAPGPSLGCPRGSAGGGADGEGAGNPEEQEDRDGRVLPGYSWGRWIERRHRQLVRSTEGTGSWLRNKPCRSARRGGGISPDGGGRENRSESRSRGRQGAVIEGPFVNFRGHRRPQPSGASSGVVAIFGR